ncbi:MAG: hypothetical protein AMXMBFR4_27990 [Candidatus Hydrogenedentota bacterium]
MNRLIQISRELAQTVGPLRFGPPVAYVYNPLVYARAPHELYLARFGGGPKEVLLVGMNPGPFGMAQTGVPFGDVAMVRDWMGIEAPVGRPIPEHPKRPIKGFRCPRGEVSGARLWGWARSVFDRPERFFKRFFVWNYCPLCFMEESGRNITPDKLPSIERTPLTLACDRALRQLVKALNPSIVIGIGGFAEKQARNALDEIRVPWIGRIPHPSPASPAANRGWAAAAEKALAQCGISLEV